MNNIEIFNASVEQHILAVQRFGKNKEIFFQCYELIRSTIENKGKILICGNGGSAADAQHFAAELMVKYKEIRSPIAAIALSTDTSILTACSNDFSFGEVYARQVVGIGNSNDLLIAISTSGKSENIIEAIKAAKLKKIDVLLLTGDNYTDEIDGINVFKAPHTTTGRVQEVHELFYHIVCELLDNEFK